MQSHHRKGFTLIELAIVLTVISLIIGGVLVGINQLRSAQIRGTISQIDRYNAAANTFLTKYGALPGDLYKPGNYNFTNAGMTGTQGLGDGNGLLESGVASHMGNYFGGETALFWGQLAQAGMIAENTTSFNTGGANAGVVVPSAAAATGSNITTFVPSAKMGRGYLFVFTENARNWFWLTGLTTATYITTAGVINGSVILTPQEAFEIDSKVDDGMPITGSVQSIQAAGPDALEGTATAGTSHATGSLAAGDCYDSTLSAYANTSTVTKNIVGCTLEIRMR